MYHLLKFHMRIKKSWIGNGSIEIKLGSLLFVLFALVSCTPEKPQTGNEHAVMGTLYQQSSAEVRALQYQAFAIARIRLDQAGICYPGAALEDSTEKPLAVVVDIDETVLDNSPYQAQGILVNFSYPIGWNDWCNLSIAEPIPGALDFLNYADSKNVRIYYISNRKEVVREGTIKNLVDKGFPQAIDEQLFLRTESVSKTARRDAVSLNHEIVLLMGDNLTDFADAFAHKSIAERAKEVDDFKAEFGNKFIMLPNSTYGEWEGAVYDYDYKASSEEKDKKRKAALKGY